MYTKKVQVSSMQYMHYNNSNTNDDDDDDDDIYMYFSIGDRHSHHISNLLIQTWN